MSAIRLRAQTLTVSFIKPWDSLGITRSATFAENEFSHESLKWWSVLDAARTFFDENPAA
jgi:hypothetical protein